MRHQSFAGGCGSEASLGYAVGTSRRLLLDAVDVYFSIQASKEPRFKLDESVLLNTIRIKDS